MEHVKALEKHIQAQDARAVEQNRVINNLQERQAVLVEGINRFAEFVNGLMNINPNQGGSGGSENPRVNRARAAPSRQQTRRNQAADVRFLKKLFKNLCFSTFVFFSFSNWMWKQSKQTPWLD